MQFNRISFVCYTGLLLVGFLCLSACSNSGSLPRSVPEKEGVSSSGIMAFIDAVEKSGQEWHSFVLLRHGKVIAEGWWDPYRPEFTQTVYSTSKTFTSTAIGFAVSEGLLTVDDPVTKFFPDQLPDTVSPNLAAMKVKHLLSMTAGQRPEPHYIRQSEHWAKGFLAVPVPDKPGNVFLYNSEASYMLSAIVQKVSGQRTLDYLRPRLLDPLGVKDALWEISPEGVNTGGWGLRVHTEDMAKLGQLYLQKGQWNGKQLLPEKWIAEATSAKIDQKPGLSDSLRATDDWAQGYCYQIWRCRNNAFRADGAFGQYIIVMPDLDAVLAVQANVYNMQEEINLVWDKLLSAFHPEPLEAKPEAAEALKQRLASLSIRPPQGIAATMVQLPADTTFTIDNNSLGIHTLAFASDNGRYTLTIDANGIVFGKEQWTAGQTARPAPMLLENTSAFVEFPPFNTFGSYCTENDSTVAFTFRYIETPHNETIRYINGSRGIRLTYSNSLNHRQIELPTAR